MRLNVGPRRYARALVNAIAISMVFVALNPASAVATSYVPIAGAGSTWDGNAIYQWSADVSQFGMRVSYAGSGSTDGRHQFINGTVDWAASDIAFQPNPDYNTPPENPSTSVYALLPVVGGGLAFAYNLHTNGQQVTNLRLSGANVAKIFTGAITTWDDPAVALDNPNIQLPNESIVPVVRSDVGAGTTQQFTAWMVDQYPAIWTAYCQQQGAPAGCGSTTLYPASRSMVAQSGELGVAGYVQQGTSEGAIGYVNYAYALNSRMPMINLLNAAGYYVPPLPNYAALALEKATVDTTDTSDPHLYLTQQLHNVYTDSDQRAYPISYYSYSIVPTVVQGQFTASKGNTLGVFLDYGLCKGQQYAASLGYAPLPLNLVQDGFDQLKRIPGADTQNFSISNCNNPTFSSSGADLLDRQTPMPPSCDQQGPTQCSDGGPSPQLPEGKPWLLLLSGLIPLGSATFWAHRRKKRESESSERLGTELPGTGHGKFGGMTKNSSEHW